MWARGRGRDRRVAIVLDSKEVADRLGVHRMTLSAWVVRGRIKPDSVGAHGKHYFSEEEIERFWREEGNSDCYWWAGEGNSRARRK